MPSARAEVVVGGAGGGEEVRDVDWKLLYVVASNRLASVRAPLLRLELHTHPLEATPVGKALPKHRALELDRAQLDALLRQMELVHTTLGD